jgi:hypothetical protein
MTARQGLGATVEQEQLVSRVVMTAWLSGRSGSAGASDVHDCDSERRKSPVRCLSKLI